MLRALLQKLRRSRRRPTDDDIRRELDFHLTMEAERRTHAGLDPDTARRSTLIDFGGVGRVREEVRDARGMTFRESFVQDVRFGLRMLARSPGYSLVAVLILALGIGANTAMFSVIDGVLLKPLPFRDGSELVVVQHAAQASNLADVGVSIPELYAYRARLKTVSNLVEYHTMSFTLLNQGEPDRVDTGVVSANFFDMLGIKPVAGRAFVEADELLGAPAVLVLSNEYWQQKFGGDPNVVGRRLQMNERVHTVVGVLPPYPQYPQRNDVYMPTSACPHRAEAQETMATDHRSFSALRVFGRLADGVSVEQAAAEVAGVASTFPEIDKLHYEPVKGFSGRASLLGEQLVQNARGMLYALVGVTSLVLIITCANVANLALSRTVRRRRELAVRAALGAGRIRLMRQLVTESVLVAILGGVAGLGLAWLSLDLLVGYVGRFTLRTEQIGIDATVLAFTGLMSVLTGIVFGVAPALSIGRGLTQAVRDGGAQAGDSAPRQRLRAVLVVGQVAVSFALLVGAALLLKSFYRLSAVPLGFQTESVMTAAFFSNLPHGSTPADSARLHRAILEGIRTSPGVRSAAATNAVPQLVVQPVPRPLRIDGRVAADGRSFEANGNVVTDGYFETLGLPLLAGRDIRIGDTAVSTRVAVINAAMARFWEGTNPIGGRFARPTAGEPVWVTVIGVVPDFRLYSVDRDVAAQFYTPLDQSGFAGGRFLVRADGPPAEIAKMIRASIRNVDVTIPVEAIQTLEEVRQGRLSTPGLTTTLVTIFAGVAVLITLAGLAGLVGTSVSQRTREFGLRMALGASRGSVLRLVLGQSLVLVIVGLAIGVGGAYLFSHLVTQFLFQTPRGDVTVYVTAALLFIVATLLASAGPARRATTIDPLKALRSE